MHIIYMASIFPKFLRKKPKNEHKKIFQNTQNTLKASKNMQVPPRLQEQKNTRRLINCLLTHKCPFSFLFYQLLLNLLDV